MATMESPSPSPSPSTENPSEHYSIDKALKNLEQANPWIEQAIQQAFLAQKTIQETFDSTITVTRSRLSQIRLTGSAHLHQTLDSVKDLKDEYRVYEEKFFDKVKEGAVVAASHPYIASGAVVGFGALAFKGPRRFLYYRTLRLFSSEEALSSADCNLLSNVLKTPTGYAMLSRADAKVKEMKQSLESLKAESEKLERRASQAEEEMKRGRTKLRHAGNQIRKAVLSAHKIEKQARGLKDVLADLPSRESSRFRSQIKNLVAEAKRERNVLAKEVTKISNYGISI